MVTNTGGEIPKDGFSNIFRMEPPGSITNMGTTNLAKEVGTGSHIDNSKSEAHVKKNPKADDVLSHNGRI